MKTPVRLGALAALVLWASAGVSPAATDLAVQDLRCEYATDPLGMDIARPRLFWRVQSEQAGQRQSAYQILVASSAEQLAKDIGDLWDSGRVESAATAHLAYAGPALKPAQQVFWKVRAWDRQGEVSAWSKPATWTMGLPAAEDWKGVWICAPTTSESLLLRKEFTVAPGLKRALAYVSGLGQYELSLNGKKVSEDLLTPGWTHFDETILYDTRDVTAELRSGANAVGITLGNGMYHVVRRHRFAKFTNSYGPLRAILHLRLEYADGRVETLASDPSWRVNAGAITFNGIYSGEDFDARLYPKGWDQPGFDDRTWAAAVPVNRPSFVLKGHSRGSEPLRVIETHAVVERRELAPGKVLFDFGQNASFMPRIRVSGPAGSTIRLTPGEVVNDKGEIDRGTMGGAHRGGAWWQYTKATDGEETWFPQFYYVGSRYLATELLPAQPEGALPKVESVEAVVVHAAARPLGEFETANPLLNRIRSLVRWAQRSNMVSVLTDCPHREKLGWIEQFHLNGPSIRYEFDVARIYTKSMWDMRNAQTEAGLVPNIAPEYTEFKGPFRDAAEWGAAFILVPWQQYEFTGDRELLAQHYDAMKRYFAYLESRADRDILSNGLGDWYDLDLSKKGQARLTPAPITATAFFFEDARTLGRIAAVLGKTEDVAFFERRAEQIRTRYREQFQRPADGLYGTASQASLAIPLVMGLVAPEHREAVLAALIKDVEQRGYATAGDIGFRYLLRALADAGRSDVIYRLVNQDEKPGYGYQIKQGATALTEAWDANRGASHNHFMLGQIIEWFYHDLAGIRPDPESPGFQSFVVNPQVVRASDLPWVRASYDSLHGRISVAWRRGAQDGLELEVVVPTNTTATIYVPAADPATVREGGQPVEGRPGLSFVRREGDRQIYRAEPGHYRFTSVW